MMALIFAVESEYLKIISLCNLYKISFKQKNIVTLNGLSEINEEQN